MTHIYRYMTGGPSLYGNANASADRAAGYENLSTPREMVKLLRKVLQDNVLSDDSEARFWETLRLDPDVYPNDKSYIAQQVTPMFNPRINVYNKPGDLTNPAVSRHVHADAGRLTFPDGQEVLVAIFMDYISDDPDDLLQASGTAQSQAQQAIKDVSKEVAQQYYPY